MISIVNKKRIKTVLKNEKIIKQNFKDTLSTQFKNELKKCDFFIHLGWHKYKKYNSKNLTNLNFLKKCKIHLKKKCKIIFLSSVSVYSNFKSIYSNEKKKVESYLIKNFAYVSIIYSGLILNKSYGPYKKLKEINKYIRIPIYFGKDFYLLSTNEKCLVSKILEMLIKFEKGKYFVYNRNDIQLDQFVKKRLKYLKFRIKVSSKIVLLLLKFLKYLNFKVLKSKFFDDLQNFFGDNPWKIIKEEIRQKN